MTADAAMSESAGRACAWQYTEPKYKGQWIDISEGQFSKYMAGDATGTKDIDWSVRALVPEQLLVEAETKLAAVRALAYELESDATGEEMSSGWRRASAYCANELRRALTGTPSEERK